MARYSALAVQPKQSENAWSHPRDDAWHPLHPMHQKLVAAISGEQVAVARPSGAARMASIFYLGLASWALVGMLVWILAT